MPLIAISNEILGTILGALHDTKCCLEQKCNNNPDETDINISDYTEEITRITVAELFLRAKISEDP